MVVMTDVYHGHCALALALAMRIAIYSCIDIGVHAGIPLTSTYIHHPVQRVLYR